MNIKCDWCGHVFSDARSFSTHLSKMEKHNFSSLEKMERYKITKIFNVSDTSIDNLIEKYKNGAGISVLRNQTGIDVTKLLDALDIRRTTKEAHNTDFYKDRLKKSVLDKYGVENVFQSQEIKDKKKQTLLNRYGVINSYLIPFVKENRLYALDEYFKDENRMKETWKKITQKINNKYGDDITNVAQLSFVKKKISDAQKLVNSKRTQDEKKSITKKCREVWNKQYWALSDEEKRALFLKRTKGWGFQSSLEVRIHKTLDELNLKYSKQVFIGNFNYDISLNDKILIEVQGDYWHSNPLYYNESDLMFDGKTAGDIWKKDEKKKNNAIKHNRYCYEIWESDMNKMSDEDIRNWVILILDEVMKKERKEL